MSESDYTPDYRQFPSEFLSDGDMYELFSRYGLIPGRMISGSKSLYREKYPDHDVMFNANIIIETKSKVWYGDLDITEDYDKLQDIADALKEPLYILYEMDGRFGEEALPVKYLMAKSKFKIPCRGTNN
jgi:hypothetical protein